MANQQNLKRSAGPGRPKGSKDSIPRTFRASIKKVFEDIASTEPTLIEKAVRAGLASAPPKSFAYVQLAAHYLDGKPTDKVDLTHSGAVTLVDEFSSSTRS